LDLYSPSRPYLQSLKHPSYLLVILTARRLILFLRGPVEDRQARFREFLYRQITRIERKSARGLESIELMVGPDLIELPELRKDEAEKVHEFIQRESIDRIKSEERFIDIDFSDELKKIEMLRGGRVISEAEYTYRRDRILKMDSEKFSEANVQRILTRRYKDGALAQRMDDQLMNRFKAELTIMFTDIVGYSRKTADKQILDVMTILAIHDGLLLPKVQLYSGSKIKKIGDALMLSFEDPVNAVKSAQAMQEALQDFNAKNQDEILIRIGINTGEVFIKEGDVFGAAVNTAAAMETFCEPGKVYITERTFELVQGDFRCEDRGVRSLKDRREIIVYSVESD